MILPDWHITQHIIAENLVISPMDVDVAGYTDHNFRRGRSIEDNAREMVEDSVMIQPNSCDIHLGNEFVLFEQNHTREFIDPKEDLEEYGEEITIEEGNGYILQPDEFILGKTRQYFEIPENMRATVEGRSSWGRLAVIPHLQAGYVDSGYKGNVTLEITNLGFEPVKLWPGMRFCQFEFSYLAAPSHQPYGGKYQGDTSVSTSKIHEDED